MARQLLLQAPCLGQVSQQNQLPWLAIQRASGNRYPATVFQRYLMAIVLARGKAARNDFAPEQPFKRLTKQLQSHRIGFANHALTIDDDDTAWQQVEQALQAIGQPLLLVELAQALRTGFCELPFKLGHAFLQQFLRVFETTRQVRETLERLLELSANAGLGRARNGGGWRKHRSHWHMSVKRWSVRWFQ